MKTAHAYPAADLHEPDLRVWLNDQRIGPRTPNTDSQLPEASSPAQPAIVRKTSLPTNAASCGEGRIYSDPPAFFT